MVRALLVSAALLVISPAAAFYGKKVDLTPVHPHAVPDGPAVLFASFAGCTSVATCSPGWRNSKFHDPLISPMTPQQPHDPLNSPMTPP